MDYILLSSVLGITAMYLAVSYDIACQWRVYFPKRMEKMPERLRLDLTKITLMFALPVWHAAAHERSCQLKNSLTYTDGVGRTDGEGIERRWWWIQPIANSTKGMGPGQRQSVLEDQWGYANWRKLVRLGMSVFYMWSFTRLP